MKNSAYDGNCMLDDWSDQYMATVVRKQTTQNHLSDKFAASERLAPVFFAGCTCSVLTLYVLLISIPDTSHVFDCPGTPFVR